METSKDRCYIRTETSPMFDFGWITSSIATINIYFGMQSSAHCVSLKTPEIPSWAMERLSITAKSFKVLSITE